MTLPRTSARARLGAAIASLALLALPLTACAPEPDEPGPAKGAEGEDESTWSEPSTAPEESEKHTDLPDSFPTDEFPIPEGATVDDTGERNAVEWFLVLLADDDADAQRLWDEIVSAGGFAVEDESETSDGGTAATLTSDTLSVQALTIEQPDGTVLLNYDIASTH